MLSCACHTKAGEKIVEPESAAALEKLHIQYNRAQVSLRGRTEKL